MMTDYLDIGKGYMGTLQYGDKEYPFCMKSQEVIYDSRYTPLIKTEVDVFHVDMPLLSLCRTTPGDEVAIVRMGNMEQKVWIEGLSVQYYLMPGETLPSRVALSFIAEIENVPAEPYEKEIILINRYDLMDLD